MSNKPPPPLRPSSAGAAKPVRRGPTEFRAAPQHATGTAQKQPTVGANDATRISVMEVPFTADSDFLNGTSSSELDLPHSEEDGSIDARERTVGGGIAIGPDVDPFESQETRIDMSSASAQAALSSLRAQDLPSFLDSDSLQGNGPNDGAHDAIHARLDVDATDPHASDLRDTDSQATAQFQTLPPSSSDSGSQLELDSEEDLFDDEEDESSEGAISRERETGAVAAPDSRRFQLGMRGRGKTLASVIIDPSALDAHEEPSSEDLMPQLQRWQVIPTHAGGTGQAEHAPNTPTNAFPMTPSKMPSKMPSNVSSNVQSNNLSSALWSDRAHEQEEPTLAAPTPTSATRPAEMFGQASARRGHNDPTMAVAYIEDAVSYLDELNGLADDLEPEVGHQLKASSLAIAQKLRRALDMLGPSDEDPS